MKLCSAVHRARHGTVAVALALALVSAVPAGDAKRSRSDRTRDLKFAAQMARQGLWREAMFRWERLLGDEPDNPYLLNNVAVAKEALGDRAGAKAAYDRAAAASRDAKLLANVDLFTRGEPKAPDAPAEPVSAAPPGAP